MPTDAWGTELEVGSVIVYPVRSGSHMHLVKARIDEIGEREEWGKNVPVLTVYRLEEASYSRQPIQTKARVTALKNVTKVS